MKPGLAKAGGFSLIEFLIIIAILGIIVTFSISYMYAAVPHANLEQSEIRLQRVLREARSDAVSRELATKVAFDITDREFWVEHYDPVGDSWSIESAVYALAEGITFAADGVDFSGDEVRFTPRGTLLSGGTISIQNTKGEVSTIQGNVATGRFPIGGGNLR